MAAALYAAVASGAARQGVNFGALSMPALPVASTGDAPESASPAEITPNAPAQTARAAEAAQAPSLPPAALSTPTPDLARISAFGQSDLPEGPVCASSAHPAYCIYTVREGDTLSHIAEAFRLNGGEIPGWELLVASNKPDIISADDFIIPGQNLRIPTSRGVVHTTDLGETVGDLAETFDVTSAEIIAANRLSDPNMIGIGQVLLIPNPKQTARAVVASAPAASAGPAPAPASARWTWPLRTSIRVTQYMTPRHPLGIDMGLSHDPTASIYAVAAGTVSFAGGDPCCSYGYYVIVDHGNGLKTLYAHLSRINVSPGQRVTQGQALGVAGATGYSFGVHLHFEVHLNGTRVDPMAYLP